MLPLSCLPFIHDFRGNLFCLTAAEEFILDSIELRLHMDSPENLHAGNDDLVDFTNNPFKHGMNSRFDMFRISPLRGMKSVVNARRSSAISGNKPLSVEIVTLFLSGAEVRVDMFRVTSRGGLHVGV